MAIHQIQDQEHSLLHSKLHFADYRLSSSTAADALAVEKIANARINVFFICFLNEFAFAMTHNYFIDLLHNIWLRGEL